MSERRAAMEAQAQEALRQARRMLHEKDYAAARQQVEAMRKEQYLALSAREEGILLMDSICIGEARERLAHIAPEDTSAMTEALREVKFYIRKLKHDRGKL